jgi:hypothetical protein
MPVSIPEAARTLGVSIDEVRRQMRTGELKSAQISTPDGLGMGVVLPNEPSEAPGGPAPVDPGQSLPPPPLLDLSATVAPSPQPPPSQTPPQPAMPDLSGLGAAPPDPIAGAPAPGIFQDPALRTPTAKPPAPSTPAPPAPPTPAAEYGFPPPPTHAPPTPGGFADPGAQAPTAAPPPEIPSGPGFDAAPTPESQITAEPFGGVAGEQGQTAQAGQGPSRDLVDALQSQVAAQTEELEARRREIQELHVLLQQLQTRALPAPESPESQGGYSEPPASRPMSSQARPAGPKKVPWWKFTLRR